MIDEGYTKFTVRWTNHRVVEHAEVEELERWRRPLFEAGLVGHYAELDIGYGNLSVRIGTGSEFLISGTQTGHLPRTGPEHYALVTAFDIDDNTVECRGAVQASSETLTHAAIYALASSVRAVVHVHDDALWRHLRDREPATAGSVAYGTPDMAREVARLFRETSFAERRLAAMGGHEGGILAIGGSLGEAAEHVLALHAARHRQKEELG